MLNAVHSPRKFRQRQVLFTAHGYLINAIRLIRDRYPIDAIDRAQSSKRCTIDGQTYRVRVVRIILAAKAPHHSFPRWLIKIEGHRAY